MCIAWFGLLGPAVALPVPELWPMSYALGGVPAAFAGFLFAWFYKPAVHRRSRWARVVLASLVSTLSAGVGFALYMAGTSWLGDGSPGLKELGPWAWLGLTLSATSLPAGCGMFAGVVCGLLLPARWLDLAVPPTDTAAA